MTKTTTKPKTVKKLFKIRLYAQCDGILTGIYQDREWLSNSVCFIDKKYACKVTYKTKPLTVGQIASMEWIIKDFDKVIQSHSRLTEVSRDTEIELGQEWKRIHLVMESGDKIVIGEHYSWFADTAKFVPYCLYGQDKFSPVYLLDMANKEVIGCVMPLRW